MDPRAKRTGRNKGAFNRAPSGLNQEVRKTGRGNVYQAPANGTWPQCVRPIIIGRGGGFDPWNITSINYISPNNKSAVVPDPLVPGDTALAHPLKNNSTDLYPSTHIPFIPDDNLFFGIKVPISHTEFFAPSGDAWFCRFQEMSAADRLTAQSTLSPPIFRLLGTELTSTSLVGNPNPDGGFEGGGNTFGMDQDIVIYCEPITIDWDPKTLTWANQPPSLTTTKINFPSYPPQPGGPFEYFGEFGPGNIFENYRLSGYSTAAQPAQTNTTIDPRDNINGDTTTPPWTARQIRPFFFGSTAETWITGLAMLTPAPTTTSVALAGYPWAYTKNYASDPYYSQILWEGQYNVAGSPTTGPFIGAKVTLILWDDPDNPAPFTTTVAGFDGSGSGGVFYIDPMNPFPSAPRVGTKIMDLPASPDDPTPTPTTVVDQSKTDRLRVDFVVYGMAIRMYCLINGGFLTIVQEPTGCDNKQFTAQYNCTAIGDVLTYPKKTVPLGSSPL